MLAMLFFNFMFLVGANEKTTNDKISHAKGTTFYGGWCEYSATVMNRWEGQAFIVLHSSTGSFRIEIPALELPLKEGKVQTMYPREQLHYRDGILIYEYRVSNGLFDDYDVVKIVIQVDPNLTNPRGFWAVEKTVYAKKKDHVFRESECFFKQADAYSK